jgi:hypothetical protein
MFLRAAMLKLSLSVLLVVAVAVVLLLLRATFSASIASAMESSVE